LTCCDVLYIFTELTCCDVLYIFTESTPFDQLWPKDCCLWHSL